MMLLILDLNFVSNVAYKAVGGKKIRSVITNSTIEIKIFHWYNN